MCQLDLAGREVLALLPNLLAGFGQLLLELREFGPARGEIARPRP